MLKYQMEMMVFHNVLESFFAFETPKVPKITPLVTADKQVRSQR